MRLGYQETKVEFDTKINVGARDHVYDLRMKFSLQTGEEKELNVKMTSTLFRNRPAILHSYFDGKKWRALVMTMDYRILAE